jgi:hypothetical protein
MNTINWRGPGAKTWRTLQGLEGEDLVELELARFNLPHLSVINLENNPETQPLHIKGWEGDPRTTLDTFHHLHPSARVLESSSPWLDPIYAAFVYTLL